MRYKQKLFILAFLIHSLNVSAQKYLLIDKGLYRAYRSVDSVTKEDLKSGWYPILKTDVDSVIKTLDVFVTIFKKGLNREGFIEYQSESLQFEIISIPHAYGDRYDITMTSITDAGKLSLRISSALLKNRDNQERIKNLYNYIKSGKVQKVI